MLDALTLDQMRTFAAVVDAGSFRGAAVGLNRAQSAVSHAIANLEAQLRVRLFDRSGYRPTLTDHGATLLSDIRTILAKVDTLRARGHGLAEGLEATLTLALDPLVSQADVSSALAGFHARLPAVAVHVHSAPMGTAADLVAGGDCVLALTTSDIGDPRLEAEALGIGSPFLPVCGASHPLGAKPDAPGGWGASDLADQTQIVVTDPSPRTAGVDYGVMSPTTWRVSDLHVKRALILAGVGWGNLPSWMVEGDLKSGRLLRISLAAQSRKEEAPLNLRLLYRLDRPLGPAARLLCELLLHKFGGDEGSAMGQAAIG